MSRTDIATRIYAAGGLGMNLGRRLAQIDGDVCFIDTSDANRTGDLDVGKCHFIHGLHGSGGNRRENYAAITPEIDEVLTHFEPGDFNLVLFSAAGGSGSVIGPLLVRQLLMNKHPTVALVVGADDSDIRTNNTINTLKSLEAISLQTNQPLVMYYQQNTGGVPRKEIDNDILFGAQALMILTNQNHAELDPMDLTNWVQYQKVTSLQPQLSFLTVETTRGEAAKILEPISTASLYADPDEDAPFGNPHYATVGYPREPDSMPFPQLHFVINTRYVEDTVSALTERQQELSKNYGSYRQRKSMIDVDDKPSEDGLIL